MSKFRKKPVVIEAVQWKGKNLDEMVQFLGDCLGPIERRPDYKLKIKGKNDVHHFWVELEVGDYVCKDHLGFHATTEDHFLSEYEKGPE